MAHVSLNVGFVAQEPGLCGPACAQMILHWQSPAAFDTSFATQEKIWYDIQQLTVPAGAAAPKAKGASGLGVCDSFPNQICECNGQFCWCTHPNALRAELEANLPYVALNVIHTATKDVLTQMLLQALGAGWAPIVLVHHGSHWVVVNGCDYQDGSPPDLTTLTLTILDPELLAPLNGVTYLHWRAFYLSAVLCGAYKDSYVMVAPGAGAPLTMKSIALEREAPVKIAAPTQILAIAETERLALVASDTWHPAFSSAQADPRRVVLVRNLDDSSLDYYLVDFVSDKRSTGRMLLDAQTGRLGQFVGIDRAGSSLPFFIFPDDVRSFVSGREVVLGSHDKLVIDAGAVVDGMLVWKPSDQSHTPLVPFYALHQSGHDFFLRVDGRLFPRLTLISGGA